MSSKDITTKDKKILEEAVSSMVLASEGSLNLQNEKWEYHGDSMDIAFLSLAYKANYLISDIKKDNEILLEIPYESERRYSACVYKNKKGEIKIAVKGSVDRVLDFCSSLDEAKKTKQKGIELASLGYRVLAVADGDFSFTDGLNLENFSDSKIKDLNFLSLVCFIDPLRAESKEAVLKCKKAGVEVNMVTGDHPATALFIAKELGIASSEKDLITGEKLGPVELEITPEFINLVSSAKVFAGVSPLQKLKIIKALMQAGHFVAVTGDGVNDAPALKQANIGVAMGSGTDITKETATMIVADDNF
jgi:magnesium-transporting ATPase (P-type)